MASTNYTLGEIRMVAFDYAPPYWLKCDGSILPISEFELLFTLIGTTYGGDGETTFQLPDLRKRVVIGSGNGYDLATQGGEESHTLTEAELPEHTHPVYGVMGNTADNSNVPTDAFFAATPTLYHDGGNNVPKTKLSPKVISPEGAAIGHNNMQPYMVLNYVMCFDGIWPH